MLSGVCLLLCGVCCLLFEIVSCWSFVVLFVVGCSWLCGVCCLLCVKC